jgi:tetrahydromethanopterin S-methyltransferase subunit F
MAYGTTGPVYGQPPQQGMVYGTTGPVYDQPPQGMVYGTTGPVYGQPGVQPPGMAYHPGIDPAYAASGYDPYGAHPGAQQPPGIADPGNAEHYDRIADVVKDIANGEQPDVSKLAALYSGFDSQFWKGALIGAVLAVLLTSNTVKTALAGTMGAIFGAL